MSNGEARKVSLQDIQMVQNLIERCLQHYMSQREVVTTLLHQAKIEPSFTEFVWQKLEAENQDFFRAYDTMLVVKDQIFKFNQLLEKQAELMDQVSKGRVVLPVSQPNGSETHQKHEIPTYHAPQLSGLSINDESLLPKNTATPNTCISMASIQPCVQVGSNVAGGHGGRFDSTGILLLAQGMHTGGLRHGTIIKAEDGYSGNSGVFGIDNNLAEHQNVIGETSISSFKGGESHSQAVTDSFLDLEMNSFGFLGQISRNFNMSYLNSEFPNSSELLGGYSRSPFLAPDTNYVDSQIQGEQDLKKLDNISLGFSCDDFGSE